MENSNSLIYQNVKEYFSNINPIAKKISNEIEQIQSVYGDLWFTFSDKEKSDIINDTLICPDISLLYYNLTSPLITRKYFSDSSNSQISQLEVAGSGQNGQVQQGTNVNNDVKSSTYDGQSLDCVHNLFRDEHSSPFSYRTKSQIDLSNCELVPYAASKTHQISEEKSILNKMQLPRVADRNSEKIINEETNQNQKQQFKTKSNSMLSNIKFLRQKVSTAIEKESPVVKTNNKDYYTKTKNPVAVSTSCTEQNNKEIYEHEDDEHSNLINNSIANESVTSLTSSLGTSDEETLTHNTEKTLCDKVALLEHDSNIRKGFDFLNNW